MYIFRVINRKKWAYYLLILGCCYNVLATENFKSTSERYYYCEIIEHVIN